MTATGQSHSSARAEAAAFAGLFCVGLYVTSFGPALPFIARESNVGLGTAGIVLTALAGGSITASAVVSLRLGRVDSCLLTALGLAGCAAGLALLSVASSFPLVLGACALLGVGDGLVVSSTHALVTIAANDVPRDINRLNVMFALGAIAGPLWTGASLEATNDITLTYAGLAAILLIAAVFAWRTPRSGSPGEEHLAINLNPAVVLMGLVLFFYVGAEFGLGAWVSSYTEQAAEASVMAGAVVSSGYWGALAIGRLLTGRLLLSHSPALLLGASIGIAGASGLVLVAVGDVLAMAFAAAFVTGLAFGPIWPLSMAIGTRGGGGSTISALVTAGNSGAVVFPAMQGAILAGAGPREGVAVTPVLCLLMLAVLLFHSRAPRPSPDTIEA
jgi:fucose permease